LLATNKFAFPLPMAQFLVLATYYVAQILIACNALPVSNPFALSLSKGHRAIGRLRQAQPERE
jgi:hypothetical protein